MKLATLAAAAAQPTPPSFTDRIDVEVVNLEVFVTDRKGNPVSGLEPDDFEILEDGQLVEITNFRDASSSVSRDASLSDSAKADVSEERNSAVASEPLLVTLFIDRTTTDPASLIRVERDLVAFLEQQAETSPDVRFALAVADPHVRFAAPITDDPSQLVSAVRALGKPQVRGLDQRLRRSQAFSSIQSDYESCEASPSCVPCQDRFESFMAYARQATYGAEAEAGVAGALLGEVVGALGGLPGAKALVYVSDGTQQRPGIDLFHFLGELCPTRERDTRSSMLEFNETGSLHRLAAVANANRVTLYPLDVGGIRAASITSVTASRKLFVPSAENDNIRIFNIQNSLQVLASETGGQAVFNQNRPLAKLLELASDFTSYYSIGYRPPESNRRTRLLRVRLKEPKKGWDVRFRRSYVSKTEEERLAERLMATLLLGEVDNPLSATLSFEPPEVDAEGKQQLPVAISTQSSSLTALPGPDGPTRTARVFLVARNEAGDRTPVRWERVEVPEGDTTLSLVVRMALGEGTWEVAVGVQDEPTRRTSYLKESVKVDG